MNLMPHSRLLVILHAEEAPLWFIKAVRKELMWEDDGRDIDPIAQRLWKAVVAESDPGDQDLYESLTRPQGNQTDRNS
jgi:hypothetical protein